MGLISKFGSLIYDETSKTCLRWSNGKEAGYVEVRGYSRINSKGKLYLCHRLVWELFNGPLLEGQNIDHIDGNPKNNRIENLRICNQTQNRANSIKQRRNTTGIKGVSFHKRDRKFCANIGFMGKSIYIGSYDTIEEAESAYLTRAKDLFEDFHRSD